MTTDIGFSIKGVGKIVAFFFCSYILSVLFILFLFPSFFLLGITLLSDSWIGMFFSAISYTPIPIFIAYLISGLILKSYTKDWGMILYCVVAIICGVINYIFGFDWAGIESTDIIVLSYIAPVFGVLTGAVVSGNFFVDKIDLAKMMRSDITTSDIIKGAVFTFFVVLCVGLVQEVKRLDSDVSIAIVDEDYDFTDEYYDLMPELSQYMDDNMKFNIRRRVKGVELQTYGTGTHDIGIQGLCSTTAEQSDVILRDFMENDIDHTTIFSNSSAFGHCIHWASKDIPKVIEYVKVYRDIVNANQDQTLGNCAETNKIGRGNVKKSVQAASC